MTKVKEIEEKVEKITQQLKSYQEKGNFTSDHISKLQEQLHEIDEKWTDGAIHEEDGSIAPGQAELSDMINEAHELVSDLLDTLPEESD